MSERFFNAYQVANLLDATPGAVVEWIQKGLLKVQQVPSGPLRISEQGLIQFLQDRGMDGQHVMARLAAYPADSGQAPAAEEDALPRLDTSTPSPAERIDRPAGGQDSSQPPDRPIGPAGLRSESIEKMFPLDVESLSDIPSPYASAAVAEPREEQPPSAQTPTETPAEELPEATSEELPEAPAEELPEAPSEEFLEAMAKKLPEAPPQAPMKEEAIDSQVESWLRADDEEEPDIEDRPQEPSCEAIDQITPAETEPVEPAERDMLLGHAKLSAEQPSEQPAEQPAGQPAEQPTAQAEEEVIAAPQAPTTSQDQIAPAAPEQPPLEAQEEAPLAAATTQDEQPPAQAEEEVTVAAEIPASPQPDESIPPTPQPPPAQSEEEAAAIETPALPEPEDESVPTIPEQPPLEAEEEAAIAAKTPLPEEETPAVPEDQNIPVTPEPSAEEAEEAEEEVLVAAETAAMPEGEYIPVNPDQPDVAPPDNLPIEETSLPAEQATPPEAAPPPSEELPPPPAGALEPATALVRDALACRASEIHIASTASALSVRLRIDGLLHDAARCGLQFPAGGDAAAMHQLSDLAGIRLADARRPARGQVDMLIDGRAVAVTVATCPTALGQRMVVSLRDPQAATPSLSLLGLSDEAESRLTGVLAGSAGLVLLLARPGDHRTAALRAVVSAMDAATRSLVAVACKPASSVAGLTPIIANPAADFPVAQAVRAAAEQDADAIILEDIPDAQTYPALLEAAELGRLVVAATWAASPAEAAVTLLDMGLKPWTLADNLKAIVAYVPLRKLCPDCRQPALPREEMPTHLELGEQDVGEAFVAGGCSKCCGQGYLGAVGCSSTLLVDKDVAAAIRRSSSRAELTKAVEQAGARPLFQAGLEMVRAGITSLEELTRALPQ